MVPGPKALRSVKKKRAPSTRKAQPKANQNPAEKKRASAISKSPPLITSVTPALQQARTATKRAQATPAQHPRSRPTLKSNTLLRAALEWAALLFCRRMQSQQRGRVKIFAAPAHGKMQVRRGGPAGASAQAHKLPGFHVVAFL